MGSLEFSPLGEGQWMSALRTELGIRVAGLGDITSRSAPLVNVNDSGPRHVNADSLTCEISLSAEWTGGWHDFLVISM